MTEPITAASYWSRLMNYYPQTSKFYKRVTKPNPASSESANAKSKSASPDDTSSVEKKSDNASPASL